MGYYINCLEYHYWILCLIMLINKVILSKELGCDKCTYIHTWIATVVVSQRASSAGIFVNPQFHRFLFTNIHVQSGNPVTFNPLRTGGPL